MKTTSITAMRTDLEIRRKLQNIIGEGELRGLLMKGKAKVHDKEEVTKNVKASMGAVDLTMEPIDLQQKELYENIVRTVDEGKTHRNYETSLKVGREMDKKLEDVTMEGRSLGLVKDPNLTREEQMMLINKTVEDKRVIQRVSTH